VISVLVERWNAHVVFDDCLWERPKQINILLAEKFLFERIEETYLHTDVRTMPRGSY